LLSSAFRGHTMLNVERFIVLSTMASQAEYYESKTRLNYERCAEYDSDHK